MDRIGVFTAIEAFVERGCAAFDGDEIENTVIVEISTKRPHPRQPSLPILTHGYQPKVGCSAGLRELSRSPHRVPPEG